MTVRRMLGPVVALILAVWLGGCSIEAAPVQPTGAAPTGVAEGVTLYFLDEHGELTENLRETGRVGSIADAVSLLLMGPGPANAALGTDIDPMTGVPNPRVTATTDEVIEIRLPFSREALPGRGIDQVVCTALGVHIQGGGSQATEVELRFVDEAPRDMEQIPGPHMEAQDQLATWPRSCPLHDASD